MPNSSFVEIANEALILCGAPTIISLDLNTDSSREAKLCSLRYRRCADIVLRSHPWNCAIKRVILAPESGTTPAFDFSYATPFPADALRILAVGPDDPDFRIEGRYFISDETALWVKYVYQVTDPTILDDLCAEAMSLRLAVDLAYPLMQSLELQTSLWKMYEASLRRAKSVDAKEEPTIEWDNKLWLDARLGDPLSPFRSNR